MCGLTVTQLKLDTLVMKRTRACRKESIQRKSQLFDEEVFVGSSETHDGWYLQYF